MTIKNNVKDLKEKIKSFGYWSVEVKQANDEIFNTKGFQKMLLINDKAKLELRSEGEFKKY